MTTTRYLRALLLARTLLDRELFPELYVSLHDADPGEGGGAEIQGLERQLVALTEIAPGVAANSNVMEFGDMPESTVSHWGLWDSEGEGRYLVGGALLVPVVAARGQTMRWREGELVLRVG